MQNGKEKVSQRQPLRTTEAGRLHTRIHQTNSNKTYYIQNNNSKQ